MWCVPATFAAPVVAHGFEPSIGRCPDKVSASSASGYRAAVAVAKWLGHSLKVAAEHYLMSREHHFEDVVGGGDREHRGPEAPTPTLCDANCISAGVRAGTHETMEPAATTGVAAGSSEIRPIAKNGLVGDIGLEPMTPSLSS